MAAIRQPIRSIHRNAPMKIRLAVALSFLCWIQIDGFASAQDSETTTKTSLVADGSKVIKLAGDMGFIEGPVWLAKKNRLVFSDIPNSKLMQWSQEDGLSEYRKSENANGNILDAKGRIISCQHGARNVIRIEADGTTTVLADKFEGKRFNSPNDVALHSNGTLWFTDPPWGLREPHEIPGHWVYKLDPKNGQVDVIYKNLAMPNGIIFSPDHRRIYIADTGGHKKHPDPKFHDFPPTILCHEIGVDGSFGKELFHIDSGSDGMAMDVKGNLYATHNGHVDVYDADGNLLQQIAVPENPANVTFGGQDNKTLFITARTSLYSVQMKNAGVQ